MLVLNADKEMLELQQLVNTALECDTKYKRDSISSQITSMLIDSEQLLLSKHDEAIYTYVTSILDNYTYETQPLYIWLKTSDKERYKFAISLHVTSMITANINIMATKQNYLEIAQTYKNNGC